MLGLKPSISLGIPRSSILIGNLRVMAKTDEQVNFRMPSELRNRLKESADENNRSLTAEIVARLQASFAEPAALPFSKNEFPDSLVLKFHELINPALVEMSRIENETRLKLAGTGLNQEQIDKAMKVKVDPEELRKKAAKRISKKPSKP